LIPRLNLEEIAASRVFPANARFFLGEEFPKSNLPSRGRVRKSPQPSGFFEVGPRDHGGGYQNQSEVRQFPRAHFS